SIGTPYEYQIIKNTSRTYTGYGYLRAGIRVPATDQRGKIILLVENGPAAALSSELDRFQNDLIADGWQVIRRNISMSDSPPSVRETIRSIYNSDPTNVKALLLFGHIAVPYSGDIVPDGHANHRGAWPADVYYGEMDGSWTDRLVNTTIAERAANHNIPGDGKFDQSQIPGEVELMVGRVDLHNMTCFANKANSRSEIDLLRQYLNKNHQFRRGLLSVERRALICDNFGDKGKDPIAGSAWRAFPGAVGSTVEEVGWDGYMPAATSGSYLWSYGSGGGSYYYSSGVGSSDQFALEDVRVVFTMFMGSYFGDWNNESNFLRAALGSGWILTSSYSGFPQSLYFPMSLGEPIGHCMRISQNNKEGGLYPPWSQGTAQVHISLHGDPTLRLHPVKSPGNLSGTSSSGRANLSWTASADSDIQGYHIYRADTSEGPFTRLTDQPLSSTTFSDTPPATGDYAYMVRAIKLEQTPSGSYLNPSLGVVASVNVTGAPISNNPLQITVHKSSDTQIMVTVTGDPGQRFRLESSTDFQTWTQQGEAALVTSSSDLPVNIDGTNGAVFLRTVNLP
ncbi:MAG: C25 family cysteine peptidase, partial [Limisphaerales bacterium]